MESSRRNERKFLDSSVFTYYSQVNEQVDDVESFASAELKDIFISNVLDGTENEELELSQNQHISRVIEKILKLAKAAQVSKFLLGLARYPAVACSDRFASHVTQTALSSSAIALYTSTADREVADSLIKSILLFCESLLENLWEHINNAYASHIVRTMLEILSGVKVMDRLLQSSSHQHREKAVDFNEANAAPPKEFKPALDQFVTELSLPEVLQGCFTSSTVSPVMQTLLHILRKSDEEKCQEICTDFISLMTKSKSSNGFFHYCCDSISSHVVQCIMMVLPEEFLMQLYSQHVSVCLHDLALHSVGNFIVQTLIRQASCDLLKSIFDDLVDNLEAILAENHLGVITSLAEACGKLHIKQKKLLRHLMKAFHCDEPKSRIYFVQLLATLTTYDMYFDDSESKEKCLVPNKQATLLNNITLHGSLLVQRLLTFENTSVIVTSILEMQPADLIAVACSQSGSHIIDVFMKSGSVGEKSKDALIGKFKGHYVDIAQDKYGSRSLENVWNCATIKQKISIATELSAKESQLSSHRFGCYSVKNFALKHFLHRRQDWETLYSEKHKKQKLFHDILGDENASKGQGAKSKNTVSSRGVRNAHGQSDEMQSVKLAVNLSSKIASAKHGAVAENSIKKIRRKKKQKTQQSSISVDRSREVDLAELDAGAEESPQVIRKKREKKQKT